MNRKIMLVDDEPDFVELAKDLLQHEPDLTVVGHAASGKEALALLPTLKPEVVILDVNMPEMGGFEVAGRLLNVSPSTKVILVSTIDDPQYDSMAQSVGAAAFLTKKRFSAEAVLAALNQT